jgi:hypothetical protein
MWQFGQENSIKFDQSAACRMTEDSLIYLQTSG